MIYWDFSQSIGVAKYKGPFTSSESERKSEKILKKVWEIKEKNWNIKEIFRFRIHFRLVWMAFNLSALSDQTWRNVEQRRTFVT